MRGRPRGRAHNLTGAWSGEYAYPYRLRRNPRRVPFNALLEDMDGSITGTIDEPNTFRRSSVARLFATVVGQRAGANVTFIKTMDGTGGATHSIHYEGVADAEFARIDGTWTIPGMWSGTFFMERAGAEAGAAIERTVEETPPSGR